MMELEARVVLHHGLNIYPLLLILEYFIANVCLYYVQETKIICREQPDRMPRAARRNAGMENVCR
jgi:hypothetical protein